MKIQFRTLNYTFYLLWALFWAFITFQVADTIKRVKPLTLTNCYTGSSGPQGLVKDYYIKRLTPGPALIRKGSDTSRQYAGFTLARFLYPAAEINQAHVATIYALYLPGHHIRSFAATAGKLPATRFRLIIDVLDEAILRYSWLNILIFVVAASSSAIYRRLTKAGNVDAEINAFYAKSRLPLILFIAFLLALLL